MEMVAVLQQRAGGGGARPAAATAPMMAAASSEKQEEGSNNKEEGGSADAELRRGPWTVDEDLTLINYIAEHGEGRWNALARAAGTTRRPESLSFMLIT